MTCRRAFELDVPAFVVDPRDPAWDDFRAHYPHCADCAAEVATWTALQASLAERHPEPEELLRWNDMPDMLAAEARDAIARHVAGCAPCRDELRALGGFAAARAANAATDAAHVSSAASVVDGDEHGDAALVHHPSASRAGGRHVERHAFARGGSARGAPGAATPGGTGRAARRGPVARVLLHPAFAYAVLALVLLLPTVRAALDRDASRAAFDTAASRPPEQAPTEPQPITGSAPGIPQERADAEEEDVTGQPDDAHVDRTAPRLMRQAPFRPEPPSAPPAAPAPAAPPPALSAKAAVQSEDGRFARERRAAEAAAPAAAGKALNDGVASVESARVGAPGGGTAAAPIRLLPATGGAARTLVVTLPPDATGAGDVEIRIVDASAGRELRQRVARNPGGKAEVHVPLPEGFTAPVLRVEVYANGAGPLLQGSVAP